MNEKLKELEALVVKHAMEKLEELATEYRRRPLFDATNLNELSEMVKLAHQIRSLLA